MLCRNGCDFLPTQEMAAMKVIESSPTKKKEGRTNGNPMPSPSRTFSGPDSEDEACWPASRFFRPHRPKWQPHPPHSGVVGYEYSRCVPQFKGLVAFDLGTTSVEAGPSGLQSLTSPSAS
jgi:hypothetical protein